MMSNAVYIQTELPNLTLPEGANAQITALCDSLISTKHDVISEIFELSEVMEPSPADIHNRVQRIVMGNHPGDECGRSVIANHL